VAEILEDLQRRAERLGLEAFLARHPHPFLIRLDERGGKDEPMPWAFKNPGGLGPNGTLGTRGMMTPVAGCLARTFELIKVTGKGPRDTVSIGRTQDNDVVVEEKSISKAHASVRPVDTGAWEMCDLQSRNGIKINGGKVARGACAPLKSGDVVHLGDVALLFLAPQDLFEALPALAG
jgi:hypothetical protein